MTTGRLVVAAPASGAGKTTVAIGLMAALSARGLRVSPHKVGPDYLDPTYHALATGRPGRNLDPFLVGEQLIGPLFRHGAAGADLAVIEGVMGLFDGRGSTDEASTAHVARLLTAPVLLVVDAAGQSRSVAALLHGFAGFDRRLRIGGVLLNRVGSRRHEEVLRAVLADHGMPVLGALPRDDAIAIPSRHLGLVPVAERGAAARERLAALAALTDKHCDLDAIVRLAGSAPPLIVPAWSAPGAVGPPVPGRPVIAVAGGPAFTFSYQETTELLAAAGAEVVPVDPVADARLPAGTRGLLIGGGFPQVHAAALAANRPLATAVAALAGSGAPIVAECAGLLYLGRSLDGAPMCGVLPVDATMTGGLTLGYREAVRHDGRPVRAHEFHRTRCRPAHGQSPAYTLADGSREGFVQGAVHASYLHPHWAAQPEL
ncbi:MAG: cobyrinic acid a,c-diamide synthase, partial [Mycobacteriales bacterium]